MTPVVLPGESPWIEEPGGLQSGDCKELDMTERLSTARRTYRLVHRIIVTVLHDRINNKNFNIKSLVQIICH